MIKKMIKDNKNMIKMIRKMIRMIEMIRRMVNTSLKSLQFTWLTHLNLKGFTDFQAPC